MKFLRIKTGTNFERLINVNSIVRIEVDSGPSTHTISVYGAPDASGLNLLGRTSVAKVEDADEAKDIDVKSWLEHNTVEIGI